MKPIVIFLSVILIELAGNMKKLIAFIGTFTPLILSGQNKELMIAN